MKIKICIGSSCHLKGSRQVVSRLQDLVSENELKDQIEMTGSFCMGRCQIGVNVKVDDEFFSVTPDTVLSFFESEVLSRLQ